MMEDLKTAQQVLSGKHELQIKMEEALSRIEEIQKTDVFDDLNLSIDDAGRSLNEVCDQERLIRELFVAGDLLGYPKMFNEIVPASLQRNFRNDEF